MFQIFIELTIVKILIYETYIKNIDKRTIRKNFTLRLKLIKKIFPNAKKIILNIRSYKDFISSNLHKWSVDKRYSKIFNKNKPDIGLHWYILNSIALYHLENILKINIIFFFMKSYTIQILIIKN